MNLAKLRPFAALYLAGMIALNAWILWGERDKIRQGYGDFSIFYTAGKIVERGQSARLYDWPLQWQIQREFAPEVTIRQGPLLYTHPPFEALAFSLLARFSFPTAVLLWTAVKILLLVFVVPVCLGRGPPRELLLPEPWIGLLCLAYFPVALDLLQGQDSMIVFLSFAFSYAALRRGAEFSAGMWLGLGLVKFQFALPVALVYLLRRKWKVFWGFSLVGSILLLVSIALVRWRGLTAYPRSLIFGAVSPQVMPNLRGVMTTLLGQAPAGFLVTVAVVGVLISAWLWKARDEDATLHLAGFSLTVVVTQYTSYHAYGHDMTLLLVPMLGLTGRILKGSEIRGWPRAVFLTAVAVLSFSPLFWFLLSRTNLFSSLAFSTMLLLSVSLAGIVRQRQSAVATVH
jgi:hypothetical protein